LSDTFRPFAEKLVRAAGVQGSGHSSEAVEAFVGALEQWIREIIYCHSVTAFRELSGVKDCGILFHRQLTMLTDDKKWIASYLNNILQNGTPPFLDVEDLCGILSKIIEGIETPAPKEGRPFGIKKYPGLVSLVFNFGKCGEMHLPARFTAYVKKGETAKIAAGSLTEALDSLREYLVANECEWLAAYLPTEHLAYVSSYDRALYAASKEVWSEREHGIPAVIP
jgi:hypothetical protein